MSTTTTTSGPAPTPRYVPAQPYPWPFDGDLRLHRGCGGNTALLVIDMQRDFCSPGGYVHRMGYDVSPMSACVDKIRAVAAACRARGVTVIYTREGHRPDLADLPDNKLWRSRQMGAGIGSDGPLGKVLVRGQPGWDIVPELTPDPAAGDLVVEKPGKGSFYSTDLDLILRGLGVRNLILTGVTADVCVHTTLREANDRGYECLLLEDCTAATDPNNYLAAVNQVGMQGGVFGSVTTSQLLVEYLNGCGD